MSKVQQPKLEGQFGKRMEVGWENARCANGGEVDSAAYSQLFSLPQGYITLNFFFKKKWTRKPEVRSGSCWWGKRSSLHAQVKAVLLCRGSKYGIYVKVFQWIARLLLRPRGIGASGSAGFLWSSGVSLCCIISSAATSSRSPHIFWCLFDTIVQNFLKLSLKLFHKLKNWSFLIFFLV